MIDGIIKADGTSRLMRAELPATYEEFRAQCHAGTQPLDVLFNALGWSQMPTFLNKANLLTDPTAALFGFGNEAVPNAIFDWLGQYNTHWWSVLHGQAGKGYKEVQTPISGSVSMTGFVSQQTIYYSKTISIDQSTGAISLSNPQTAVIGGNSVTTVNDHINMFSPILALAPVYITNVYNNTSTIYCLPAGSTAGTGNSTIYANKTTVGYDPIMYDRADIPARVVTSQVYNIPAGETTYEHSADRNAYPDSGTVDGLTYEYLGIPFQNAVTASRIATGSYTGTGTYGSGNPCSVTFDFAPKIVFMVSNTDSSQSNNDGDMGARANYSTVMSADVLTTSFGRCLGFGYLSPTSNLTYGKKSADGKTFYWYHNASAQYQFNASGTKYYFVAIG